MSCLPHSGISVTQNLLFDFYSCVLNDLIVSVFMIGNSLKTDIKRRIETWGYKKNIYGMSNLKNEATV